MNLSRTETGFTFCAIIVCLPSLWGLLVSPTYVHCRPCAIAQDLRSLWAFFPIAQNVSLCCYATRKALWLLGTLGKEPYVALATAKAKVLPEERWHIELLGREEPCTPYRVSIKLLMERVFKIKTCILNKISNLFFPMVKTLYLWVIKDYRRRTSVPF